MKQSDNQHFYARVIDDAMRMAMIEWRKESYGGRSTLRAFGSWGNFFSWKLSLKDCFIVAIKLTFHTEMCGPTGNYSPNSIEKALYPQIDQMCELYNESFSDIEAMRWSYTGDEWQKNILPLTVNLSPTLDEIWQKFHSTSFSRFPSSHQRTSSSSSAATVPLGISTSSPSSAKMDKTVTPTRTSTPKRELPTPDAVAQEDLSNLTTQPILSAEAPDHDGHTTLARATAEDSMPNPEAMMNIYADLRNTAKLPPSEAVAKFDREKAERLALQREAEQREKDAKAAEVSERVKGAATEADRRRAERQQELEKEKGKSSFGQGMLKKTQRPSQTSQSASGDTASTQVDFRRRLKKTGSDQSKDR